VTAQVGRDGRTVAGTPRELEGDWHTINDTVIAYGTALVEDPARIRAVTALGLDETLACRPGRWRTRKWCDWDLLDTIAADWGRSAGIGKIDGRTSWS